MRFTPWVLDPAQASLTGRRCILRQADDRGTPMDPKDGAREAISGIQDRLIELSHRIHAHPELGFEEERASNWLESALADAGFRVEAGICDLPTAFAARSGSGPL